MKNKVLLLNNSESLDGLLERELSSVHELVRIKETKELYDTVKNSPDLQTIIINSEMFEEPGFEIVEKLRACTDDPIVSIVVLADEISNETVLSLFEAGATDFVNLSRPENVIVNRIKNHLLYTDKVQSLAIEEVKLTELVNTTMMQSSFYGACLDLVSELQFVDDEEQIAVYLFDFMQQYGIHSAISFNAPNNHFNFDQQTFYCSPLEEQVFELLKNKGRIYEFGNRAVFNSPCVSLLIKNMPEHHTINYGLFIDIFAKLIPSIEMSFKNLLNKKKLKNTQDQLKSTVEKVKDAVMELQSSKQELMDKMILDIGLSFHNYEFTDAQEAFLTELIESNVVSQTANHEMFFEINQQLEGVVSSLEQTKEEQKPIAETVNSTAGDFELF